MQAKSVFTVSAVLLITVVLCAAGQAEEVERFVGGRSRKMMDTETLIRNWRAVEMPGVPTDRKTTVAAAIRDRRYNLTGESRSPVAAVHCSAGAPVFQLDFGTLDVGCYVVRVIAMVKTEDLTQYRKPLYVDFKVNSKRGGETNWYRHRVPYWDDFYCVTDLYFNADEKRPYSGTLTVGDGSMVGLYVHSIEFHDCLRGLARRAGKVHPGFFTFGEREQLRAVSRRDEVLGQVRREVSLDGYLASDAEPLTGVPRRMRDELLWHAVPPMNLQYIAEYDEGFLSRTMQPGEMSRDEVTHKYGSWKLPVRLSSMWFTPFLLKNDTLELTYTLDDLLNHGPLPDPYPFKDRGGGIWFPRRGDMGHAEHWMPIAYQAGLWSEGARLPLAPYHGNDFVHRLPYLYHALGDTKAARDAAFLLARWAYIYPSFTDAQMLGYSVIAPASMYNRDTRLVQRRFGYQRPANLRSGLLQSYDFLFDYINGNQELAQAVGRFVPWIQTDEDLRRMIETRLVQYSAKQVMRWHRWNDKGTPGMLMQSIAVQQDPEITRPWIEQLWKQTWIYPYREAGLPDYVSTTTQRDGTTTIGSVFYSWSGSPFRGLAELTQRYVKNGGNSRYDLTDFDRFRKLVASCTFPLDSAVAGGYPMTIGDVGGPAKSRLFTAMSNFEEGFRTGFRWSEDPRLAWLVRHYYGRRDESDEQWAAVEAAAAKQGRNPLLAGQSRVLANWAGILESGQDSDDYRFKRTVYMRVGTGHGHAHGDTLDLQVMAHGVRMVNDLGHRGSYAQPSPVSTITHNVVEVNGDGGRQGIWQGHAWINTFAPAKGAQYMYGIAVPPSDKGKHRDRAVALIDVDQGQPATRPPSTPVYNERTVHAPNVVTPNSYIFDVQRVIGGSRHTCCFHGTISDDFALNIQNKSSKIDGDDEQYLRKFLRGEEFRYVGEAPDSVLATWRLRRAEETITASDRNGKALALKQTNAEKTMLGPDYDATAPRKYTRLHLFGRKGEHMMVGYITPFAERVQGTWPYLMVQRDGTDLQSVYAAIIEPYAGQPFITSAREIAIATVRSDLIHADLKGNDAGAMRPVAVEVKTTNGRTDLCISDPMAKPRQIGDVTVTARFAYVSRDADGLRMAHVVEGTRLDTPWGTLTLPKSEYNAKVVKVDYWKRRLWLSAALPTHIIGKQIEIGNTKHKTAFRIASHEIENGKSVISFHKAADLSYAHVQAVFPNQRRVAVNVGPVEGTYPGISEGLTVTTGDLSKAWKCKVFGRQGEYNYVYELSQPVSTNDFPIGSVLRLWEYGVGDQVRIPATAVIRRAPNGEHIGESVFDANWSEKR
ncbi:MAG TPA: hypothetical protein QF564_08450 [Pirellulaceae bacterium]|nr:hypothetical protein [Pirellulaceae bacterium]